MKKPWRIMRTAAFLLLSAATLQAQLVTWTSKDPEAVESFRIGVQSFQRGTFNDAILQHERALAAVPGDPLILSWLGRSYFRSGLESTAIDRWSQAAIAGGNSPFLESRREFIASRRLAAGMPRSIERLVETGRLESRVGKTKIFHRPTWISPSADGGFWIVGYGSNSVLKFDVNGLQREKIVGPLGGLDRPYAMLERPAGGFWVTEYNSDRITLLGRTGLKEARIGSTGSGPGQFLGPGALAQDEHGYLYVSDYGNRRIVKLSEDGSFVTSFGERVDAFPGLMAPTGLAWKGGSLFVVDRGRKSLYQFDRDGNFLRTIADASSGLKNPEGLSSADGSILLLTDEDRVYAVDTETETVVKLFSSQERGSRYAHAVYDVNGNVLVADFNSSLVEVLSPASLVYAGLFVNVMRVNAESFPIVEMEVMVQDAHGKALTGLAKRNFYLSERVSRQEERQEGIKSVSYLIDSLQPPSSLELLGEGEDAPSLDSVILFDGGLELKANLTASREMLGRDLARLPALGRFSWVFGGAKPVADSGISPAAAISRRISTAGSADWRFDLSLRLAASALSSAGSRRAVFYVSSGQVSDTRFDAYSLSDLASFLGNNAICFVAIIVGKAAVDPALEYLARQTGGGIYALGRPEGLSPVFENLANKRMGIYKLRMLSAADSEFGRKYLPFSLEVYLMKKSGRDEFGYFAPLR